jgi:hypothetical protein
LKKVLFLSLSFKIVVVVTLCEIMASYFRAVPRCGNCQTQCPTVIEDTTRSPSRTILIEANQFNRRLATSSTSNEQDVKVNVWAASAPPSTQSISKYPMDTFVLEKVNALRNGSIVLREELNIETLKGYGEDEEEEGDIDKDFNAINDDDESIDDDETSSTHS